MKKINLVLIITFIIAFCFPYQQLGAQNNRTDKEKEREIEQTIVKQKKELNEQQKALEKYKVEIDIDSDQIEDEMRDLEEELNNSGLQNYHIYSRNGRRSFSFDAPLPPDVPNAPDAHRFYRFTTGDSERTAWDFSKTVKENSFSQEYAFDVEKTVKNVIMSVMGDCKEGEIRITIEMPDGKKYSDIVLDGYGNLNWRKSFRISETENQDKAGEWKFKIDSKKATGYFKISLQTY